MKARHLRSFIVDPELCNGTSYRREVIPRPALRGSPERQVDPPSSEAFVIKRQQGLDVAEDSKSCAKRKLMEDEMNPMTSCGHVP
jgi:hypothetical protein